MDPFDLGTLFAHREILEGLDPGGPPTLHVVTPLRACGSVALLPGSFNPPTAAHVLLAERALRDGYDCVMFVLARHTAGKEPTGLIPEDRLLALRATIAEPLGVGVCSHGLYADQADAAARAFPGADLRFLVGSDKVLQIFEDGWYADRGDALERLFARAALVVAPRSDQGEALRETLSAPRNRRYADRVEILRLHPAVGDLSSTRVRGLLRSGADPAGLVPPPVADLLARVRAFAPPVQVGAEEVDPYAVRGALVDLLWRARADPAGVDLEALVTHAIAPEGNVLRARLRDGTAGADDIERALAAASR